MTRSFGALTHVADRSDFYYPTMPLALWNVVFYFRDYTPRAVHGGHSAEAAAGIGTYLGSLPAGTPVYLVGAPRIFLSNGAVRFLAREPQGFDVVERPASVADLPPRPATTSGWVYVALPERAQELEPVRAAFPNGAVRQGWSHSGERLFVAYEVPASA